MKFVPLCLAGILALTVSTGPATASAHATATATPAPNPRGPVPRPPAPGDDVVRRVGEPTARVTTKGVDTVAVIRAYWTAPDGTTEAEVDRQFARAATWFDVVSRGQFGIRVTSAPDWVRIATSSCSRSNPGLLMKRAIAAQRRATPGFKPAAYDHIIVYFPHVASCDYAGLGSLPGRYVWINGLFPNGFSSLDISVTTHELGHNLNLDHASSLSCTAGGAPTTISRTCARPVEYGDVADDMGGGDKDLLTSDGAYPAPYFSAPQMARLGWLNSRLQQARPCQDVTLAPYEGGSGLAAVSIVGSGGVKYWLEWRHPAAGSYDDGLPSGLTDGPLLHLTLPGEKHTYLLDGRPDGQGNVLDAAIPSGGSVTTPEGYTFSVGAVGATAGVRLSTARPTAPLRVRTRAIPGGAKVTWGAPPCAGASPIAGYRIDYRVRGGKTWRKAATARGNRQSFRIALPRRSRYAVRVTAVNAQGPSIRATPAARLVRPFAPRAGLRVKSTRLITIGRTARETVTLRHPRTRRPLANVAVTLQKRSVGTPWRTVASVRTSRAGIASLRTSPRTTTRYRWVFAGNAGLSRTTSRVVRVAVAPRVGLLQTKKLVRKGGTAILYGLIAPKRVGLPVALQARSGGRWATVETTRTVRRTLPSGRKVVGYRLVVRFPLTGTFRLRTVTSATRTNATGVSKVVTVRVR